MDTNFTVIYRWRLIPGREASFCEGWDRITRSLLAERNSRGSRLHQADDGTWVAYAQWPDRETWQRSRDADPIDPEASQMMRNAIEETYDNILLQPVTDHLQHSSGES